SHPEAVLVDPDPSAHRAYVTVTNTDELSIIDTRSMTVVQTLLLERGWGLGAAPVALAVDAVRHELLVAEEGTDDVLVVSLPKNGNAAGYRILGRVPTAAFPADVQVHGSKWVYLSAKGMGTGAYLHGANPLSANDSDDRIK